MLKDSTNFCKVCFESVVSTEWRPSSGFDPDMREFNCPKCKKKFYKVIRGSHRREERLSTLESYRA